MLRMTLVIVASSMLLSSCAILPVAATMGGMSSGLGLSTIGTTVIGQTAGQVLGTVTRETVRGIKGEGEYPERNQGNGWNGDAQQQFFAETADLRRQLNDRQFEYQEARRNPDTSRQELFRIESEIREKQYKIDKIADRYRTS